MPVFERIQFFHPERTDSYKLTGLARGGEQLAKLKRNHAKELLLELASLQTSFVPLDEAIKSIGVQMPLNMSSSPRLNMALLISSENWMRERQKSSAD